MSASGRGVQCGTGTIHRGGGAVSLDDRVRLARPFGVDGGSQCGVTESSARVLW